MLAPLPALPTPFERLFAAEYPRVVAIARRIVGERAEAEDIAQDVFAKCAGRAIDETIANSLYVMAARFALNRVRSRTRRFARERAYVDAELEPRFDSDADPGVLVLRREAAREVRLALRRVGDRNATILALRYGGELRYAEIAVAIGAPVSQIGTLLARAECALRLEMTRASHP